eukprot:2225-Heterococcus_DN1.PRE.3
MVPPLLLPLRLREAQLSYRAISCCCSRCCSLSAVPPPVSIAAAALLQRGMVCCRVVRTTTQCVVLGVVWFGVFEGGQPFWPQSKGPKQGYSNPAQCGKPDRHGAGA